MKSIRLVSPRYHVNKGQKKVATLRKEQMTNRELKDFDVSIEGKGYSLEQNAASDRVVKEASKSIKEDSLENSRYSGRINYRNNHRQHKTDN